MLAHIRIVLEIRPDINLLSTCAVTQPRQFLRESGSIKLTVMSFKKF